ncbi:hypothetical protein OG230_00710 [Streptomyces sp. NBC_00234]|uniref:hypothetical protein n=1 Tax=Streptomyces sp. NBC_00234 TaxID=2903638 RepID=UPI002E2943C2|nr:hypothetical protein [Streptomyces sp. NBC_00234]
MDVEKIADELYGLKPAEFVQVRDAYAAEARKAKDTAGAKAIAALRRPALAAWASNLLPRERRQEAEQFLALGEALREAHRTLDAERLREATRQQHQLITTLARTAAGLAKEAGQPVSGTVLHEIEQSLHAVLTHPDVAEQWSKGRLVKVPEATVGFAAVTPETAPDRPAPAERPEPKKPGRGADRRKDLERARTTAEKADAKAGRLEQELDEARDAQEAAGGKAEEASERVRRLERELKEARRAKAETGAAAAEADSALQAAERALREARHSAEHAARAVQHLERQSGL